MTKNLLLMSSASQGQQPYLQHAIGHLKPWTEKHKKWLFIPYGAIKFNYQQYLTIVQNALAPLNIEIECLSNHNDPKQAILNAEGIIVGGGNSFKLLSMLYQNDLLEVIRHKIAQGAPYVGWSAGAVIAGPTIKTTNDMPIVESPSLDALGLVNFMINCHFSNQQQTSNSLGTVAETLKEFYRFNQGATIIALASGSSLLMDNGKLTLQGNEHGYLFNASLENAVIKPDTDINYVNF